MYSPYVRLESPQEVELIAKRDAYMEKHTGTPVMISVNPGGFQSYGWHQVYQVREGQYLAEIECYALLIKFLTDLLL